MFRTVTILLSICLFAKAAEKKADSCGLPPFTDNLPDTEKVKVVEIWQNYRSGNCEDQRKATKDVLQSLPSDVRNKALHHQLPPFLKGTSSDVRKQFEELWKDDGISRTEKPEKFKALAEKLLNAQQLREFNKFHKEMVRRRDEFQRKLSKLSPEARAAHEKLSELREQRHRIFKEVSASAREELNSLYRTTDHHEFRL